MVTFTKILQTCSEVPSRIWGCYIIRWIFSINICWSVHLLCWFKSLVFLPWSLLSVVNHPDLTNSPVGLSWGHPWQTVPFATSLLIFRFKTFFKASTDSQSSSIHSESRYQFLSVVKVLNCLNFVVHSLMRTLAGKGVVASLLLHLLHRKSCWITNTKLICIPTS